jgi:CRISPR-associated protein Cmr5
MGIAKNLDQERAAFAWKAIGAKPDETYVKLAKGMPALVMGNGLMQTLAFLNSKDKGKGHGDLLRHVIEWLGKRFDNFGPDFDGAIQWLYGSPPSEYLRATDEALEILRWIRQLADARK